jgi:hypothetical protein
MLRGREVRPIAKLGLLMSFVAAGPFQDHFHFHSTRKTIETLFLPATTLQLTHTHTQKTPTVITGIELPRLRATIQGQLKSSRDRASTRQNQQDYKESEDGAQQGKGRKSGLHR